MSNCTSGCRTPGAHRTWGECARSKGIQIGDVGGTGTAKRWDSDLTAYANARTQGIQPSGIDRASVDRAVRISHEAGEGFNA